MPEYPCLEPIFRHFQTRRWRRGRLVVPALSVNQQNDGQDAAESPLKICLAMPLINEVPEIDDQNLTTEGAFTMDTETAEAVYETIARQTVELIELRRTYASLMAQYQRAAHQVDALRAELGGALSSGFERCADETVQAVQDAASALSVTVELMRAEKCSPRVEQAVERAQRAAAHAVKLVHEGRGRHGHDARAGYRSRLARAEAEADQPVSAIV